MTTLHCDEFYCGSCKQIYPSHLGIPRYGRLDCPWCHDCVIDGVLCSLCSICKSIPTFDSLSMPVKLVCKVKKDLMESAIGELRLEDMLLLIKTTTEWLEKYKVIKESTVNDIKKSAMLPYINEPAEIASSLSEAVRAARVFDCRYFNNTDDCSECFAATPFAAPSVAPFVTPSVAPFVAPSVAPFVAPFVDVDAPLLDCFPKGPDAPLSR